MTWDHSRGFDPMVATSERFGETRPGVSITWERRSLQAFADRPIKEMASDYDLMVIDHPHVGEVARGGELLPLDSLGHDAELVRLASRSVGASHRSYEFDGRQWALAIDAATPVAAFRSDIIENAPSEWAEVVELARKGLVAFALIPLNSLMTFMGLAKNIGIEIAAGEDRFIDKAAGTRILDLMKEIVALLDPECLKLDPIGVYDWMGSSADGPGILAVRVRLFELLSGRLLQVPFDVRGCARRGRRRSARHGHRRNRHRHLRKLQESDGCGGLCVLDSRKRMPERSVLPIRRAARARRRLGERRVQCGNEKFLQKHSRNLGNRLAETAPRRLHGVSGQGRRHCARLPAQRSFRLGNTGTA